MGGRGGIGDLEAALLEIVAVFEEGTGNKTRALRVHHHVDVAGADKNVAIGGAVDEVHLVLQAGAAAADDGQTQGTVRAALAGEQRDQLLRGLLGDLAKLLVPDCDLGGRFGGFRHFHASNMVLIEGRRKQWRGVP